MNRPRLRPMPKDQVLLLPPFDGLRLEQIHLPTSGAQLAQARDVLLDQAFVGFDTEVRPTFKAGEPIRGPDVVQFATRGAAYVFQLHDESGVDVVREVLAAQNVVKAGFDLRSDQKQLMHRLGIHAQPLLDLDFVFAARGYPPSIGVKAAIAMLFQRRLLKSKRVTTSNWSTRVLEPRQILYAANDAFAAWAVLDALDMEPGALPIWDAGLPPPPLIRT